MKREKIACTGCGYEVYIRSKGKCPLCRKRERDAIKRQKKQKKDPAKGKFFAEMIAELRKNPYSATGRRIYSPSSWNVCHILPKRYFKSVATNPDNIVFLTRDEHARMDKLIDENRFEELELEMPVIAAYIKEQFLKIEGLVTERNKMFNNFKKFAQ